MTETQQEGYNFIKQQGEQSVLLLKILETEQKEKRDLNLVVQYLKKYIIMLHIKLAKLKKYYFLQTILALVIFSILLLLYLFDKMQTDKLNLRD